MTDLTDEERTLLRSYLTYDSGRGDPSTMPLEGLSGKAMVLAEGDCLLSGLEAAVHLFEISGCEVIVPEGMESGGKVVDGWTVLEVRGPLPGMLRCERTALNVLSRMSSIATYASELVDMVRSSGSDCRLAGTRKTTPGFGPFEKRALIDGGALPHRMTLSDACMFKDNHIASLKVNGSSLKEALEAVRKMRGPYLLIEAEAEDGETAMEALTSGADVIMIDNATIASFTDLAMELRQRARELGRSIVIEASGGIDASNLLEYTPHADVVSMGALTYPPVHVSFRMEII
ncbi:MAG: carboxylating nicotinate-nucleotide diphosphorylase [Candidatus Thermoplasmatota archaeon]|nr:carboxylating nicotinate-nucleotide diphosphorylase [Candidatus Thermoplasmatota archaeon]